METKVATAVSNKMIMDPAVNKGVMEVVKRNMDLAVNKEDMEVVKMTMEAVNREVNKGDMEAVKMNVVNREEETTMAVVADTELMRT